MAEKARRPHGTGSVFYDKNKDRWIGTYEAGWSKRGTRRRRQVSAKTQRGARAKLREAISKAESAEAPELGGKPTVKRWADQWIERRAEKVRPSSWRADRAAITNWIVPAIGNRRLDQLAPADMRAVHRAMFTAGRETSSVQRAHATLTKMLRDAIIEGHAVSQRVLMIEGPGTGESDRDALPLEDALAILAVASRRPDASRWVAAMLQGMRPAECLGLTWNAIDLDARSVDVSWQLSALPYLVKRDPDSGFRIPRGYEVRRLVGATHLVRPKTKSGKRVIPLVPWMTSALEAWREVAPTSRHGLVWPRSNGEPQSDKRDRATWWQITDAAQVAVTEPSPDGTGPEVHGRRPDLYEARHTAATLLRAAGADNDTITAIMGHASILSTQAYLHTDLSQTRAALEQMASKLGLGETGSS